MRVQGRAYAMPQAMLPGRWGRQGGVMGKLGRRGNSVWAGEGKATQCVCQKAMLFCYKNEAQTMSRRELPPPPGVCLGACLEPMP